MQILFIHQNFPGQYRYLARHFVEDPQWQCYAVGERKNVKAQFAMVPKGISMLGYDMPEDTAKGLPVHSREFVGQLARGQAISQLLLRQKAKGLEPDIICAHPGWGEGLYLKEIFPKAKLVYFLEYFFKPDGPLVDFDDQFPTPLSQRMGFRVKNAQNLIALDTADVGVSPTNWQASTFPVEYQHKIRVIHDGVDTAVVSPKSGATVTLNDLSKGECRFTAEDEVISFAVRNLEPSRGFHRYMRALPALQRARPKANFVIVGGNETSYVRGHESGRSWREALLDEVGGELDLSRIFFVGRVPYQSLLELFSITALHIYMTVPFVLSWSMLEAMACEAPVLASATGPVTEIIEEGENGFLFDYFSADQLAEQVTRLMESPALRSKVGKRARQYIVENYDLDSRCLPRHLALIDEVLASR